MRVAPANILDLSDSIWDMFIGKQVTDWNLIEKLQRDLLRSYSTGKLTAEQTVWLLDDILAAGTKRGNMIE